MYGLQNGLAVIGAKDTVEIPVPRNDDWIKKIWAKFRRHHTDVQPQNKQITDSTELPQQINELDSKIAEMKK